MNVIEFVLHDPKAAITTALSTAATGLGHAIDVIPDDIGKVGTLVGIVLSGVLIYTHFRNGRAENKKLRAETELRELEVEALKKKLHGSDKATTAPENDA